MKPSLFSQSVREHQHLQIHWNVNFKVLSTGLTTPVGWLSLPQLTILSRSAIEVFGGVFCCCHDLLVGFFCPCREFFHRTELDLFLFLFTSFLKTIHSTLELLLNRISILDGWIWLTHYLGVNKQNAMCQDIEKIVH